MNHNLPTIYTDPRTIYTQPPPLYDPPEHPRPRPAAPAASVQPEPAPVVTPPPSPKVWQRNHRQTLTTRTAHAPMASLPTVHRSRGPADDDPKRWQKYLRNIRQPLIREAHGKPGDTAPAPRILPKPSLFIH